jgi:hypothetical protein
MAFVNVGLYMNVFQFVDGYVLVIYCVVCLCFCCEFQFWAYCFKIVQYALDVHVVGVKDHQNVVNISEIVYNPMFGR